MYRKVQLISENTIKENLQLDSNVSYAYIAPTIKTVQDIRLQTVLGSVLYDSIRKAIVADPTLAQPANSDIKILVDNYIKDCLLNEIIAELQIPISFKTRNLGVVQNTDDNVQAADMESVKYLRNYYLNFAKFYEERLTNFLCANTDKYPQYLERESNGIAPTNINYTCPIVLNNKKKIK